MESNGLLTHDGSVQNHFWQSVAEKIRATESHRQGCYEVHLTDGGDKLPCPVADAYVAQANDKPALVLAIPTETLPVDVHGVIGVSVGVMKLTATVARTKQSNGILTVTLIDPQVTEKTIPGGPVTKEHLEYLAA